MTALVPFAGSLALTVALLVLVMLTGLRRRRRLHLFLVICALSALGITIFFAERLGDRYDLEAAGLITPIHLTIAKITTAAYLLPVVTGVMTWRDNRWRRLHRVFAFSVLGLTLLTALTGTLMLLSAEPITPAG